LTNERAGLEHLIDEFYGRLREIGDDIKKKRAVMKMRFLFAGVLSVDYSSKVPALLLTEALGV
jgi:hypothetical protein